MLLLTCSFYHAQQKEYVLTDLQNNRQYLKKDSLSAAKFLDSLASGSYFFTEVKSVKQNGSRTEIYFDKGKNYNQVYVSVSDSLAKTAKIPQDFFTKNLDSLKRQLNTEFVRQGYAFNRVKSSYKGQKDGIPVVILSVNLDRLRTVSGIVVKGYDKVPQRFIKNLEKEYKNRPYTDNTLSEINSNLQNHTFVTLERPPQTQFTRDSTNVYLFLQKRKVNSFDGMIGFGNDKSEKFTFNGTLNVSFRNIFNGFEELNLYWQRNPDRGQTFRFNADVPYVLRSNVGSRFALNIYRQDSTYANVQVMPSVYYHLSNRQRIGLRGTFETSTVMNTLYIAARDFSKAGVGAWFDYTAPTDISLFQYRTRVRAEADLMSTTYSDAGTRSAQQRYFLSGEHNLPISGRHYLNIKGEGGMLEGSENFSANELFRFGGWNSFRGFNEDTLLANLYYFGNAEYRYLASDNAFFDAFLQYGKLHNDVLSARPSLYSFGLGFHVFVPVGLMSFQISNGNEFGNTVKFGDTKIHWGILSRF